MDPVAPEEPGAIEETEGPVDPVGPADPVDPVGPDDPVDPIGPADPVGPVPPK